MGRTLLPHTLTNSLTALLSQHTTHCTYHLTPPYFISRTYWTSHLQTTRTCLTHRALHRTPLIPHPSSHTPHPTPLIPHAAPRTPHPAPLIPHPSSRTPHPTPLIPHASSHTPHPTPLIPHPSSHTPHPAPLLPHAAPRTPHPTPLIPHPSSRTPHLAHPSSRTPHPARLIPHASSRTPHLAHRTSHTAYRSTFTVPLTSYAGYADLNLKDRVHLLEMCWTEVIVCGLVWRSTPVTEHDILVFAPDLHFNRLVLMKTIIDSYG